MVSHVFLQSEVGDPFTIYKERLSAQPVFWDEQNQLWAMYSYRVCRDVFMHPGAHIPPVATAGLDEYALAITARLARLSNPPMHAAAKQAALLLFHHRREPRVEDMMTALLPGQGAGLEMDWISQVGRKLPVGSILQGFGMGGEESIFIAGRMDALLTLMQPVKTTAGVAVINAMAKEIYTLLEEQLLRRRFIKEIVNALVAAHAVSPEEALALCVSNLAGLLVQSYDAGRGLLGNALLQLLRRPAPGGAGNDYIQACVAETCRFDPPVHTTRRIAVQDMHPGGHPIQRGQMMLLVMAAANRDARQFKMPDLFDAGRHNNDEHLTFGFGAHACVAKAFSTRLTAQALSFLFDTRAAVRLVEKKIEYEPLANARVPRQLFIACSQQGRR